MGQGGACCAKGRGRRDQGQCFFSPELTHDQLTEEINLGFQTGKERVSKEEAISLFGVVAKQPIT